MENNNQDLMDNMSNQQNDSSNQNAALNEESRKKAMPASTIYLYGVITGLAIALVVSATSLTIMKRKAEKTQLVVTTQPEAIQENDSVISKKTDEKLKLLENSIHEYYLDDIDHEKLEDGIYRGMVEALGDPYSTYYNSEELEKVRESTDGVYYGIGAYVGIDADTSFCKVTGIIKNTPAEEAGLQAGDIIYEVDGTSTYEMTTTDVVALIKGEENTNVEVTIVRKGEKDYLHFTLTRRQIEAPTVNYEMKDDKIAYIQITQFDTVTSGQFSENLRQAREDGMKSMILDLRNNPGGTLDSVVKISQELLPKGLIVYTEDKKGNRKEYSCDGMNQLDVPLVVLVNDNSASAAEILAGAIKDYKIGTLVGTKTFGKGIVQRLFGITDGSAVKLTVSHYYTPYGNDIHKVGVMPDEELELDYDLYLEDGTDNQIERAVEILKEKMNKEK